MTSNLKPQILIVDDDPEVNETTKLILENEGYIIDTAVNGKDALQKIRENQYRILFLDLDLPDIMGDEVAKIILSEDIKLDIIFITGHKTLKTMIKDANMPYTVLLKPINPEIFAL